MMQNENPKYPITITLRIDWCDLDIFKHVNNVMYFKYIQTARVNYWEQSKLVSMYEEDGIIPMLLSTQCRYIKPMYYPGDVTVKSSITYIKNSSFGLSHLLFDHHGDLVAEAQDVMVLLNEKTQQKVTVPDEIRAHIKSIEGY